MEKNKILLILFKIAHQLCFDWVDFINYLCLQLNKDSQLS